MKNICVALAFFAFVGVSAQTKKATVSGSTATTVATEKLTPEATAERDMKALAAVITIDESVKVDVNKIFITKYRAKDDSSLSTERLSALSSYVESSLLNFIGQSNFAKVKANTKLYNQLVK
jgi:hypothetical protein